MPRKNRTRPVVLRRIDSRGAHIDADRAPRWERDPEYHAEIIRERAERRATRSRIKDAWADAERRAAEGRR